MEITRNELIKRAEIILEKNLGLELSGWTDGNGFPRAKDDDLDIGFTHDLDIHLEEGYILFSVKMSVSIKRCGGNPSVDELHRLANRISRAAAAMEAFNMMEYVIREELPKVER